MENRSVRRRLNNDCSLVAVFDDAVVDLPQLSLAELSILCGKTLLEYERVLDEERPAIQTDDSNTEASVTDLFSDILASLGSWAAGGRAPFPGVSAKRAERWNAYNDCEKWVYYAVHLMNKVMIWSEEGSSFLCTQVSGVLCSDSYAHVAYILTLATLWNKSALNTTQLHVNLVAYASLEHVWFGYVRADSEDSTISSVVQMTIDESAEVECGLIVNRLETTVEYDDFALIAHQNTLACQKIESTIASPLSEGDFSFLLWAKLFQRMLEIYERVNGCIEVNTHFPEDKLSAFRGYLWKGYNILHDFPRSDNLHIHVYFLLAKLLTAYPAVPAGQVVEYSNEFEALAAVLRMNSAHYLARQCLVEAYLRIGENYLAHQHCLYLLDQLAGHIEEETEVGAPVAVTAHSTAAELLETGLADIHQLHLRGEEGYEKLDCIPSVGDKIHVEWALDDDLVLYTGVIDVHPDRTSLCISYDDDTERGLHRRRIENALHLVNINDPTDPYLEKYFMDEPANESDDDLTEQQD